MVLIAGIVGISGMVILKNDIGNLSDGYREITYEYSENKRYTLEIRTLLYKHQALVANHDGGGFGGKNTPSTKRRRRIRRTVSAICSMSLAAE